MLRVGGLSVVPAAKDVALRIAVAQSHHGREARAPLLHRCVQRMRACERVAHRNFHVNWAKGVDAAHQDEVRTCAS